MARRPGSTADRSGGEVVEKLKAGLGCAKKKKNPLALNLTLQVNWNTPSTLWSMEAAASCCDFAFPLQQQGGVSGLIGRWTEPNTGAVLEFRPPNIRPEQERNDANQSVFTSKNGSVKVWTFMESRSLPARLAHCCSRMLSIQSDLSLSYFVKQLLQEN